MADDEEEAKKERDEKRAMNADHSGCAGKEEDGTARVRVTVFTAFCLL